MQAKLLDRIPHFLADVSGTYLLPLCCIFLPWPIAFKMLRGFSRCRILFREAANTAWRESRRFGGVLDERNWKQRFRLLRMVDQVDIYLPLVRSERWRRKYIVQSGTWPQPGTACVFLTYHWGAGNWVWSILREQRLSAHFLARRPRGRPLGTTLLSHWYGVFRVWGLRRIGSLGVILTGGSANVIAGALRAGESVVGMLDLAATEQQQVLKFPLLDDVLRLPVGLARLAIETSSRIVIFSFGLNFDSGQRNIKIETLPAGITLEAATRCYVAHLDLRLRESPESWHMWHEAPMMFVSQNFDQK